MDLVDKIRFQGLTETNYFQNNLDLTENLFLYERTNNALNILQKVYSQMNITNVYWNKHNTANNLKTKNKQCKLFHGFDSINNNTLNYTYLIYDNETIAATDRTNFNIYDQIEEKNHLSKLTTISILSDIINNNCFSYITTISNEIKEMDDHLNKIISFDMSGENFKATKVIYSCITKYLKSEHYSIITNVFISKFIKLPFQLESMSALLMITNPIKKELSYRVDLYNLAKRKAVEYCKNNNIPINQIENEVNYLLLDLE